MPDRSIFSFSAHETSGLQDFWRVYEDNYEELARITLEAAAEDPLLRSIVASMTPEQLEVEAREGRERLRKGIRGDWEPYLAALKMQGTLYAGIGLSYASWYRLVRTISREITPRLVDRFGGDGERLTGAIMGMQAFFDSALAVIGETYIAAKEQAKTAIVESALDGIVTMDHEGNIVDLNPAATRIFGFTREQAIGQPLAELMIPPALRERHIEGVRRSTSGEATRSVLGRRLQMPALHAAGHEFPIELSIIRLEARDPPVFAGFVRDLSKDREVEALREAARRLESEKQQIQQASRLKSEFLANMSHELRTPLNSIIGFAQLLHDGEVEPDMPEHQEFLGDILRSGRHLLQLINDVLDLSKVEAGKLEFHPERVDISTIIGEVLAILRTTAAEKSIRVVTEVDANLGPVEIDASRFKQVLYNYLSNALKFTPENGTIHVRARPEGAHSFRLEVDDTGPGISSSDRGRLFTEFQQLDSSPGKQHPGTGLGLALTRRLVEAQGGTVGVRSSLGEGSTFHAVLPRRAAATPTPAAVSHAGAPGAPSILVIEDDPRDQKLLVDALTRAGYGVETAATGAAAVACCRERTFDAITLDLLLPDASGLDVLRAIRSEDKNRDVPVVVITVVTEHGAVGGFAVHDILPKPVDGPAMLSSLARAQLHPHSTGSVLVVEDDPASARLMAATLGQLGYRSTCVERASSALAAAERSTPLAVVLDLTLPEIDGFEFLDRFRRLPRCRRVPVIVWTSRDLTREEHARLMASAQGVLQKGQGVGAALIDELRALLSHGAPEVSP